MRTFDLVFLVFGGLHAGVTSSAPQLWAQCRSENGTETPCGEGMICIPDSEYFGLCYTEVVDVLGQCGGLDWSVSCVNGSTCERESKEWAACKLTIDELSSAAEWQQCDFHGNGNTCDDGLTCVSDNDYHGLCVKEVAELWEQCGGSNWTTNCGTGSSCEFKTHSYSQCVSTDAHLQLDYSGKNSSLDDITAPSNRQEAIELASFVDMSSIVKPLMQLQEIGLVMKKIPCLIRSIIFPDTTCKRDSPSQ